MKMKEDVFFEELVECMDIGSIEINKDSVFAEMEDYDSMAALSIIAFADEKFGKTLSAEQLQNMKTVNDLMELIGPDNFEK